MAKRKPKIKKVLSLTACGRHAWVEAVIERPLKDLTVRIRKEISEVPPDLMRKFRKDHA